MAMKPSVNHRGKVSKGEKKTNILAFVILRLDESDIVFDPTFCLPSPSPSPSLSPSPSPLVHGINHLLKCLRIVPFQFIVFMISLSQVLNSSCLLPLQKFFFLHFLIVHLIEVKLSHA